MSLYIKMTECGLNGETMPDFKSSS